MARQVMNSFLQQERPTRLLADGAFFVTPGGVRLAVRTRLVHGRNLGSILRPRTIAVGPSPLLRRRPLIVNLGIGPLGIRPSRNLARTGRNFHLATLSATYSDRARHEYAPEIQAN